MDNSKSGVLISAISNEGASYERTVAADFNVGNEEYYLLIGKQRIGWINGGDDSGHTLIFELTPEEFAKLKNGVEVRIVYGDQEVPWRTWKFGKLDKSKLDR